MGKRWGERPGVVGAGSDNRLDHAAAKQNLAARPCASASARRTGEPAIVANRAIRDIGSGMDFKPADTGSVAAFLAIVLFVAGAFLAAVRHAHRFDRTGPWRPTMRAGVGAGAWLGFLSAVTASGWLLSLPLHGLPFFFGAVLLVSAAVGFSPLGGRLAAGVPIFALVGFQAFRLPLELVLQGWSVGGTIPATMTWTGQNWDVVSGIVALLAAPFAIRSRAIAWTANLIGLVLLLNVIRVAVMSSPLPFAWGQEPPLLLAFHLPYMLIAPVCVGGALIGHIVLTRALLRGQGGV